MRSTRYCFVLLYLFPLRPRTQLRKSWSQSSMFDQGSLVYHVTMPPIIIRERTSRYPAHVPRGQLKTPYYPRVVPVAATSDLMPRAGSAHSFPGFAPNPSRPLVPRYAEGRSWKEAVDLTLLLTTKCPTCKGLGLGPPSAVLSYRCRICGRPCNTLDDALSQNPLVLVLLRPTGGLTWQYLRERPPRTPQTTEKRMKVARVNASTPTPHACSAVGGCDWTNLTGFYTNHVRDARAPSHGWHED